MTSLLARRKPLPKSSPESDPRFRRVMDQLKAGAAKTKAHPPASKKAAEAAGAAKGPPNERAAAGKAKQVDKIKEAPAKKPEPNSFLDLLRAEIAKAMPKTLGETEKFDDKAQQMKGGLKNSATQQKNEAAGPVAGASRQAPGQEGEAKQETPIPPEGAPAPPNVAAGEGMPAPKSDADVSLQDSKQETEQQMKDAEVTPTQLQKANDPRFSAVLEAKGQVAKQADAAPAQYRGSERATLAGAAASAQNTTRQSAAAMIGVRRGSGTRVLTRQQQQRARDEAKRRAVVSNIEKIYNDTKVRVEAKLSSLDTEVSTMFDQGTEAALNAMTTFVNARIRSYKIDRYLSIPIVGAARWIRDQFLGLPSEVNVFYEQGRELFRARMDALIVRVANLVEKRLKEAKDEVARGQAAIKTYVNSLGPELRSIGQQAQRDVAGRFEELTRSIDDKKNQLASSLAAKYKEAFDKANEALKAIQDANTGLVAAFVGKLLEVIKALMEFKDKLMSILRKGAATIKLIIADPIGFLSNLIAAVAGGIRAFAKNITTHMVEGFKQWLFGSLGGLGIEIPRDLSLPSILKLVLSVLGITYDRMRAKAVRLIGERNVRLIEKLVEYLRVLINGGPAALWEKLKEDLASLKEMVIDAIKNYIIETAVKRGIAKIVSMFNPVGAIIGAIMAIYDIVMFVVEKAKQIMAFVESVVNSIYDIATGNIGGAIAKVEQSLAKAIPLLLGFLAQFAGLGKITEKIQEFIKKIQSKVDAAVEKAIAKIVAFIKRMFGGGREGREGSAGGNAESRLASAVAEAESAIKAEDATTESVQARLPAIQAKYGLTALRLIRDDEDDLHIDATINPRRGGRPEPLFTSEQLRNLRQLAEQWAQQIREKNERTEFLANPRQYLAGGQGREARVKIGDAVEILGIPVVREHARGLTVLRNAHLQFFNAQGEAIGGAQAEIDFIILGDSSVKELVSAKPRTSDVRRAVDIAALNHYRNCPTSPSAIATYAMANFGGRNTPYREAASVQVRYSGDNGGGSQALASFRGRYLSRTIVRELIVRPLTPSRSPGASPRRGALTLRATRSQILNRMVRLITARLR